MEPNTPPLRSTERATETPADAPRGVQIYDRPASADQLPWARILMFSVPVLLSILLSLALFMWVT
jgi:hypothetical protein